MYGEIHLACDDFNVVPSEDALKRLFAFLSPSGTLKVFYYASPFRWNSGLPDKLFANASFSSVDDWLRVGRHPNAIRTVMTMQETKWGMDLGNELDGIVPRNIRDDFTAWIVTIILGPSEISAFAEDRTAAITSFQIVVWGNGAPNDTQAYADYFMRSRQVADLLELFRRETGHNLIALPVIS
jgi:hypothetical protein